MMRFGCTMLRQLLPPPAALGNHQAIECKSNGPCREKADQTRQTERVHESDCRLGPMGFHLGCCCCCSFICHFSLSSFGSKTFGQFCQCSNSSSSNLTRSPSPVFICLPLLVRPFIGLSTLGFSIQFSPVQRLSVLPSFLLHYICCALLTHSFGEIVFLTR